MNTIPEPVVFVSTANQEHSYANFVAKLFKIGTPDEEHMHAALGVCGEAGELADAIKKSVVYGKELDRKNLVEELGDLRFYMQQLMNMHHITEEEVLQGNADKLAKRYPTGGYRAEDAIARADKAEEQTIVEVSFCHDLEDGWYVIKQPDGKKVELNNMPDVRTTLKENNWKAYWVGDVYYKPEDIELMPEVEVSDMFATTIRSPVQVGVGISAVDFAASDEIQEFTSDRNPSSVLPDTKPLPWGLNHGQLGNEDC